MKILFFAPHSAIWVHAFPEALVAESLAQHGHEIVYVGCKGALKSHCISMAAHGVTFASPSAAKERICGLCMRNERVIREQFGFRGFDLAESIVTEDVRFAEATFAELSPENCVDLKIGGVEVGSIALYELLLQNKKTKLEFSSEEWARYRASVINAVLVLKAAERMFDAERPDRILVYNGLYSVNRVVGRFAEIRGVPQYFLHAGDNLSTRLQTLILARDHAFDYYGRLRERWTTVREWPASSEAMRAATDHFLEVLRGRSPWAYSPAAGGNSDLRGFFGVGEGRKVISATMSSNDERFAGESIGALKSNVESAFRTQVEWIDALIGYVKERSDLFLIIRVHPREFPNKREGVLSEHAKLLRAAFANLPENVRVNWPTDNVSLYDLAGITDVCVNGWSSAGKEMAWLGLPVVLYSRELTLYPADLNSVGTTAGRYFELLEQALREGWDVERIRKVYRWCALEYKYGSLDISDGFSRGESRSFFARARGRLQRMAGLTWEERSDCRRRPQRLRSAPHFDRMIVEEMATALDLDPIDKSVSQTDETLYLKREVKRLFEGLYAAAADARQPDLAKRLSAFAEAAPNMP